jgi:hypothetical protein
MPKKMSLKERTEICCGYMPFVKRRRNLDRHEEHIKGGYFQKGCPKCAAFIVKYEQRRNWRNAPKGRIKEVVF